MERLNHYIKFTCKAIILAFTVYCFWGEAYILAIMGILVLIMSNVDEIVNLLRKEKKDE